MIRKFADADADSLVELWFETNVKAHNFIDEPYWLSNRELVRDSLCEATIYVYEDEKEIRGFIGLMDNYVAGIFVDFRHQSAGIGKALLDCVKKDCVALQLKVFTKNRRAMKFYEREGFVVLKEQIDESTGEAETVMNWKRQDNDV